MHPMSEVFDLIQATIAARITPDARVVAIEPRDGAQGYSGATLRYYDVAYERAGAPGQVALVTKDASLLERRSLAWLGERRLPAPFNYTTDLTTDAPALVCMQHVGDAPPSGDPDRLTAQALASIHAAALGCTEELAWLPRADPAFAAEWLVDNCWRKSWQSLLDGQEYIAPGGRRYGPIARAAEFAAEFGAYTQPLEDAAARFLLAMAELWKEGDSLTLIHGDFHNDQVHADSDRAYVIDWDFAHYGPLYIDLPNYFTREQALLYRDALAELGHDIPPEVFLARYDTIRPYPGFKYFSIGLYNWCFGDPPRQPAYVQHFIDMVLPSLNS
jgi:Phosphotransferase enzyme family